MTQGLRTILSHLESLGEDRQADVRADAVVQSKRRSTRARSERAGS